MLVLPKIDYVVTNLGFIEDTEEPCIIYKKREGGQTSWVRTLSEYVNKDVLKTNKDKDLLSEELNNLKLRIDEGDECYHYKHPDQFYQIVGVGFIERNGQPCVVYQAEYGDQLTWVRTEEEFFMEDNFHLGIKALIRNSKGQILLLKVNKEKLRGFTGDAYWDIPGGRIQRDSTIEETLKREVGEEIGIKSVSNIKPFLMVLSKIRIPQGEGSVGLILGAYTCEIPEDIKIKLSEEHTEANWFMPVEASKLLETKYPVEFTEKIKEL